MYVRDDRSCGELDEIDNEGDDCPQNDSCRMNNLNGQPEMRPWPTTAVVAYSALAIVSAAISIVHKSVGTR